MAKQYFVVFSLTAGIALPDFLQNKSPIPVPIKAILAAIFEL